MVRVDFDEKRAGRAIEDLISEHRNIHKPGTAVIQAVRRVICTCRMPPRFPFREHVGGRLRLSSQEMQ